MEEGYVCLLDGLQAVEVNAAAGALGSAALIRCYRELLDDYTVRYRVCRGAAEPREGPRLLAEMALIELKEEEPDRLGERGRGI